MTNSIKNSRIKLVLVFSLFLGPLCVAFLWYYGFGAAFSPKGQVNHSPLITPVVSLSGFSDTLNTGENFDLESLKRRWTIIHSIESQCEELCQKSLYNTRQTRIAVGKDANRIQRLLIVDSQQLIEELSTNHADLLFIVRQDSDLFKQIEAVLERNDIGENDAIMIDPLGNIMMVIPVDLNPSLLLKDLKKLLKLSRVG